MLAELDYDYRVHVQQEADKNIAVRFFIEAVHNEEKSVAEGRPIFDDVEFIEKRVRGDRNNIVMRPARKDDIRQFAEAYRNFKGGEENPASGTPLKEWPSISKSMLEELKHMGFFTVEQLANASDSVCSKFAGLQTYKQKAQAFIEYAKGAAPLERYAHELKELKNSSETQARLLAEQAEIIKALQAQNEALSKKAK
jgi:hypothetical protein